MARAIGAATMVDRYLPVATPDGCSTFDAPNGVKPQAWWKLLKGAGLVRGRYIETKWADGVRVSGSFAPAWAMALTHAIKSISLQPQEIDYVRRVFEKAGREPDFARACEVVMQARGPDGVFSFVGEIMPR